MKNKWHDYLRIFLPNMWIMNFPYSESWDKALNRLLDEYPFVLTSPPHEATLGDVTVWTENYPYASFHPVIKGREQDVRPSRLTILKARRHLEDAGFKDATEFDDIG